MDLHYWQSCPSLAQCHLCDQIIEIAAMREHVSEECAEAASDRGRALVAQLTPANPQACVCPLCLAPLEQDSEEAWRAHLLQPPYCPKNPRKV